MSAAHAPADPLPGWPMLLGGAQLRGLAFHWKELRWKQLAFLCTPELGSRTSKGDKLPMRGWSRESCEAME